jgi:3-deoxy-D-manno-octulosonic-acid transferase
MAGVYFLYSATLALLLTLTLPWWLLQMLRLGKYRAGLRERLGMVPARIRLAAGDTAGDVAAGLEAARSGTRQTPPLWPRALGVAWIHAVSVGEVMAIAPLVGQLREQGYRVVVSTTTHTGQRLARDKFGGAHVFYFPLDFALCIRPYLRALRPALVILAETEFWPNFLRLAGASGARLVVVNARISDRSLPRYLRFRGLLSRVLAPVELFLAQSEGDAERLRAVGAAPERVEVLGNLKFDAAPPVESATVTQLGEQLRVTGGPILVAGSTVEDEEEPVLAAFRMVLGEYPGASLVLAPRHRERFEAVAQLLSERHFRFVRRSALNAGQNATQDAAQNATQDAAQDSAAHNAGQADLRGTVLLLDTLGELAAIYRYSDIAFVGGSLVPMGGHNILEPAFFGRAILTGPHTENFRDIMACFESQRAVVRCTTKNLGITFLLLLREGSEREALGQRAQAVLAAQRGATARSVARILELAGRGRA